MPPGLTDTDVSGVMVKPNITNGKDDIADFVVPVRQCPSISSSSAAVASKQKQETAGVWTELFAGHRCKADLCIRYLAAACSPRSGGTCIWLQVDVAICAITTRVVERLALT
jgi:hypothetical protein